MRFVVFTRWMTLGGECLCEDYGIPENSTLMKFMWFLRRGPL